MANYDDLDIYNGDFEHDMWVDFDHCENTGTPDVFFAGAKRQVGYDEDKFTFYRLGLQSLPEKANGVAPSSASPPADPQRWTVRFFLGF